ncbi:GIY-YIG nuclease family protein [Brevundimonas sp.]|uniref:GIY-YIG nuclease family protein n=1 Tax=Brevundimonas sp. TaxID=1871086 RepID=UPI0028AF3E92|nr:GIY-YIG nuclease family protein [Brevundimonas sp.]
MHPTERKALVAAYKERPVIAGVFAVICSATGRSWVGQSRHIDTQQNSLWFSLKTGGSPFASLQAEWKAHGPDSFRFEQLDRLSPDLSEMARKDELKKRAALWTARLAAEAL